MKSDQERQGEVWKDRPVAGQEDRVYAILRGYLKDYREKQKAMPWYKIMGLALIAHTRETGIDDRP